MVRVVPEVLTPTNGTVPSRAVLFVFVSSAGKGGDGEMRGFHTALIGGVDLNFSKIKNAQRRNEAPRLVGQGERPVGPMGSRSAFRLVPPVDLSGPPRTPDLPRKRSSRRWKRTVTKRFRWICLSDWQLPKSKNNIPHHDRRTGCSAGKPRYTARTFAYQPPATPRPPLVKDTSPIQRRS